MDQLSLWGEEFTLKEEDTKSILKKAKAPKKLDTMTTEQKLKSSFVSIYDKLELIKDNVYRILGHYINDIMVINNYDDYKKYIDKAIENGKIAIDTETNNTLKVFEDCKLMGLCIYTPGEKAAYVPVNHRKFTVKYNDKGKEQLVIGDLLENQLTEAQIAEQLKRLGNTYTVFHNAIFDIEVLQQTTGTRVHVDWDTSVGASLIDENELRALKAQYRLHVDPTQEKYEIEHLFAGFPYAIFDPRLFAYYAAVDPLITYRLYDEYQLPELSKPENHEVLELMRKVEIPIIDVVVDMETAGIGVNSEYAAKMSVLYHAKSDEKQKEIDAEIAANQHLIDAWKLSPEANARQKVFQPKKTKMSEAKILEQYPYVDEKTKKRYKWSSKPPVEQLSDPIDLNSGTQLAIFLYDILKAPSVNKEKPRATDKDTLDQLAEEEHIKVCELIKEKRAIDILINTFIDAIPAGVDKNGRVHGRFDPQGTVTGRFASKEPNMQNIPSHDKTVRMIFKPAVEEHAVTCFNNTYKVKDIDEVFTDKGWKFVKELQVGDELELEENTFDTVKSIEKQDNYYIIGV